MREPILAVELFNHFFVGDMYIIELFEPGAAGRLAGSSDLFVGLYLYIFPS